MFHPFAIKNYPFHHIKNLQAVVNDQFEEGILSALKLPLLKTVKTVQTHVQL